MTKRQEKMEARIAMIRKLLDGGREMTAAEIAREMKFPTVNAFYFWIGGQRVSYQLPLYETDDFPRKYGLLGSGGAM